MKHAMLILTLVLAGCMGSEQGCRWDGLTDADCTEGNAGDGVSAAPQAAPEPVARPEPAKQPHSTPEPQPAPVARPERPASKPEATKPEPEKSDYADWSNPGDEALFEGYSADEVRAKKDLLAQARSEAEAAAKAEAAGGFNR